MELLACSAAEGSAGLTRFLFRPKGPAVHPARAEGRGRICDDDVVRPNGPVVLLEESRMAAPFLEIHRDFTASATTIYHGYSMAEFIHEIAKNNQPDDEENRANRHGNIGPAIPPHDRD